MKYKECNFMMTYKNLYCALVRSMSEAIDLYDEGKAFLPAKRCTKPFWTQKTKSSPTTSFPTNLSAVPPQLKTRKRGERSNAAFGKQSAAEANVTRASR